jgi:hypothetical protein
MLPVELSELIEIAKGFGVTDRTTINAVIVIQDGALQAHKDKAEVSRKIADAHQIH